MTIANVQIEDSGQYRCRVDGRKTSQFDEKNYTLDVQCVYNKECVLSVCVVQCGVCVCVCVIQCTECLHDAVCSVIRSVY